MTQHAGLSPDRWSRFDVDQQVLMIGNEMHRTSKLLSYTEAAVEGRRRGYARVLRLTDLTIGCQEGRALRRELLRWRDLIAALYASPAALPDAHRRAFRALLQLRPTAAKQIPLLGL